MQFDENSFCGDTVSGSFNMRSRDADNILDQMYLSKCVRSMYSVMQSDGNSFWDVVSESFSKRSRDEDNILNRIYLMEYVRIIKMMI